MEVRLDAVRKTISSSLYTVSLVPNGIFLHNHESNYVRFIRYKIIGAVDNYSSRKNIKIRDSNEKVIVRIPNADFANFEGLYKEILSGWTIFWSK